MSGPHQNLPPDFASMFPPYFDSGHGQAMIPNSAYYGGKYQSRQSNLDPTTTVFPDFEGPPRPIPSAQNTTRVRKRVGATGEHIKFRRTRSGCYTCRNRRVKCDECRPICERCRKGSRECVYPEPSSSTKSRRSSTRSGSVDGEGSSQEEGEGEDVLYEEDDSPTQTFAEPQSAISANSQNSGLPALSDPPALTHDSSPTPSTEGSVPLGHPRTAIPAIRASGSTARARSTSHKQWSHLPKEVRFYLQYARTRLSRHHWGLKLDPSNFLQTTLIEVALTFEPLLYAVVGFAAYHYTLTKPDGRLHDFLGYYQKSVSLLRQSFKKKPTIATILTILQLATIEEFLGDWVNLMSHQKAAYMLITELYTPQSMTKNDSLRKTILWYIRFDTFVGIISGTGIQLGREWFEMQYQFFLRQCLEFPEDLAPKYEERFAWIRLTGFDVAHLIRSRAKGAISEEDFMKQHKVFQHKVLEFRPALHPALTDPSKLALDFSGGEGRDPNDIVDPYEPNLLFAGDIFDTNILLSDFYAFELIFNNQLTTMQGTPEPLAGRNCALKICQLFEAAHCCPDSPPGIILGLQAGLALAVLFLGQGEREVMWARRQFATIERQGYTYPVTLRMKLEDLWNVDLSEWWLPNGEGQPALSSQIRNFITSKPSDEKGEHLRDFKGLFHALTLSDNSSPESSQQSPSGQDRQTLSRRNSSRAPNARAVSDDYNFDSELMSAYDHDLARAESPEFEWT